MPGRRNPKIWAETASLQDIKVYSKSITSSNWTDVGEVHLHENRDGQTTCQYAKRTTAGGLLKLPEGPLVYTTVSTLLPSDWEQLNTDTACLGCNEIGSIRHVATRRLVFIDIAENVADAAAKERAHAEGISFAFGEDDRAFRGDRYVFNVLTWIELGHRQRQSKTTFWARARDGKVYRLTLATSSEVERMADNAEAKGESISVLEDMQRSTGRCSLRPGMRGTLPSGAEGMWVYGENTHHDHTNAAALTPEQAEEKLSAGSLSEADRSMFNFTRHPASEPFFYGKPDPQPLQLVGYITMTWKRAPELDEYGSLYAVQLWQYQLSDLVRPRANE
ncbi:hypothetical protein F4780DRAFT_777770 [Xylariomycetidae sp. FL0641]|nr:hypothetical protein F4780DRAFT_777770 [Xylariomycetidae sp. FL0641]